MNNSSNYLKYLTEEEGKQIIETEHAFLAYRIIGQEMFITDLYVDPDYRKTGKALLLGKRAEAIAKELGCKFLSCNVFAYEHNKHRAADKIRLYTKFGFSIHAANNNIITMIKEV